MNLIDQTKADEGFRPLPYRCKNLVLTIGYGRNIDAEHGGAGINEDEASFLLRNDLGAAEMDLRTIFPEWTNFGIVRQSALVNMRFQLGSGGFRSFKKMIWHIRRNNWKLAAVEALDSKWARLDSPERAWRVANQIETGLDLFR